ncbi:MAG: AMP-binding protein [Aliishimia sp.]
MNIAVWLEQQALADGERPALYLGRNLVASYGQFNAQALALAGAMQSIGIKPGDRVAIFMSNCPDYLIVQYGIWAAGGVAVPINAKLHGREAAYILENSGTSLIFASSKLRDVLTGAGVSASICCPGEIGYAGMLAQTPLSFPVSRRSEDLAWLFYTSGTTGQPKGVMITHGMLMTVSLCYPTDVDAVLPEDATLYSAAMSHGAGLYNMIHVKAGAAHVCPESGGFDPSEIFDLAAHFGSVQMFAAPTMVKRMVETAKAAGATGQGLRTVVYAGGPMYTADIIEAVETFGPVFVQIYGQGECPMGITALSRRDVSDRTHPDWKARLGSVGRAQASVEVAIGDAKARLLPPNTQGEIMVRGASVMPGYWQARDATAKTLMNGWLMTGDMGMLDEAGYLTLQDRSKDMIITGGSNVYPREVEDVLLSHPGLTEASVVGRAHPEWGEEVVAFIVGTALEADLDQLCQDHIARFKRPKAYIRVDDLPKNNYGKVLKTELRARLT